MENDELTTNPMGTGLGAPGAGALSSSVDIQVEQPMPYDVDVSLDGSEPGAPVNPLSDSTSHDANLAEHLEESALNKIAASIVEWVDQDRQSRTEWEKLLKDGMEILGIAPISEDDRPFKGASTVTHPLIAEAAIQFQSRAIEELFPSAGPTKCKTIPDAAPPVVSQGNRVEGFYNYYLTEGDTGYYDDSDKMIFVLALHGHIFRKVYEDPITREVRARHVTAANLLVPYAAQSLDDADHYTHVFEMPLNDIKRAQRSGFYRDVAISAPPANDGMTDAGREAEDDRARPRPCCRRSRPSATLDVRMG